MRTLPAILAALALACGGPSAHASNQAWGELLHELGEATTETRRVELSRDAWKDLGPRARMRLIEQLAEDAGEETEQFFAERMGKEVNAFMRRRLALVLGRFATRKDTLEALELLAARDEVTQLDNGSCWTGEGHARKEAELAADRVRTRRAQVLELGDDSTITETPDVGVSWFGTSPWSGEHR